MFGECVAVKRVCVVVEQVRVDRGCIRGVCEMCCS